MNPFLRDVLAFLKDGRHFTRIRPDKTESGWRTVEFAFTDGRSESRLYECDPATFLGWWQDTTTYLRSTAEAFRDEADTL